jgi:hypothetical protein
MFVEPYNCNANDPKDPDPKQNLSSDAFIGLIQEEYNLANCIYGNGASRSTNVAMHQSHGSGNKSLKAHIKKDKARSKPYCKICKWEGH